MLRDRFFRAGIVITLLYQLTTASLLLATALVLQSGLGFSPFHNRPAAHPLRPWGDVFHRRRRPAIASSWA